MAGLPSVPGNVMPYFQEASKATGIPLDVVAAQNYYESSYGTDIGPSSTGAMGPWQFEPYTWPGYSNQPFSAATQWGPSTLAYIALMKSLLHSEGGNVRNALAAYNAGAGNISAGLGYADHILSLANASGNLQVGTPNTPPPSTPSTTGSPFSWPGDVLGFFKDAKTFVDSLLWIVNPASWLRIGSFAVAVLLILMGAWILIKVGSDDPLIKLPSTIPIPV